MLKPTYIKHKIPNLISINKIVTIHYFEFGKNFAFGGEVHDFWEIVYVDKGEIIVTAGSKDYILKAGDLIFHKPNEFHNINANGKIASNVFIISFVCNSPAMNIFKNKITPLPDKYKKLVYLIIEEGKASYSLPFFNPNLRELEPLSDSPLGGQQMIRTYLEQLLISLLRIENSKGAPQIFPSKAQLENSLANVVLDILENNIYDKTTIADLCQKTNYGKTYLCTTFKNITGFSLMAYYNKLKIDEAKKLIREQNYNFAQISSQLCFDNPQYFSRTFKRLVGMTPKEYSRSVKVD